MYASFSAVDMVKVWMRDRQERMRQQDDLTEDMAMMRQAFSAQNQMAAAQTRLLGTARAQEKGQPKQISTGNLFDDFDEGEYDE